MAESKINCTRGELLWSGNMPSTSGQSITYDTKGYRAFCFEASSGVLMFGDKSWGGGNIGVYGSNTGANTYGYRYNHTDNGTLTTLTVSSENTGCSGGYALRKIYGIF